MSILIFFIVLAVLILSHELGHFLAAKSSGIKVEEFGLGFPPRLASVKKGETVYSLNAIPFGGFVKIFGESPDADSLTGPDSGRSLTSKNRLIQAWVLSAGVIFNVILAWLLISIGLIIGLPTSADLAGGEMNLQNPRLVVTSVLPDSPAGRAGLPANIFVEYLADKHSTTSQLTVSGMQNFIAQHADQSIKVGYIEQLSTTTPAQLKEVTLTPISGLVADAPAIGVSLETIGFLQLPLSQAFVYGAKLTWEMTAGTAVAFYNLLKGMLGGASVMQTITGPVGLVGIIGSSAALGFSYLLSLVAIISINLAIINLLPFPALDGGRLLFLAIEAVIRRPLPPKFSNWSNAIGFFLLLSLMAVVIYHDIVRLIIKK